MQGLTEAEKSSGIQLGHGEYSDPTFLNTAKEMNWIPIEIKSDNINSNKTYSNFQIK